jgi:hypothetical protein
MDLTCVRHRATRTPGADGVTVRSRRSRSLTLVMGPLVAVISMLAVLAVLVAPGVAFAGNGAIKLALTPVGSTGLYFDLSMRPGETRSLAVELSNVGDTSIEARTYAADVYTIINGGFGARRRDEAQTGTTTWLDYATNDLQLPAGKSTQKKFAVVVPADARPGEYITSLVLESNQPISGSGNVSLDQVVRTAVAVVVTVPGQRSPGLSIGDATQRVVAGKSVVSIAVENSGNVRLKPVVAFALLDAAGAQVSQASVQMDTFYANTKTFVEVALAERLLPGVYTVHLSLDDAVQGVRVDSETIVLLVGAAAETASDAAVGSGPSGARQRVGEGQVSLAVLTLVLVVGFVLCGVLVGLIITVRRRRRIRTGSGQDA